MSRDDMFNWRANGETASACFGIIDRAMQRLKKAEAENRAKGRPGQKRQAVALKASPQSKAKVPKPRAVAPRQPSLYGRHNPVPMALKLQIVRRLNNDETAGSIAADVRLSQCAVSKIARLAGIWRGPGWKGHLKKDRAA